jgi:oxygen-independent coproporphyrinogen-3 oxidase
VSAVSEAPDLGIYVHVPFCERVCPYCDFAVEAVGRLDPAVESEYADLVIRELELLLREPGSDLEGRPLATIYLGGGTPSLLEPRTVERLLESFRRAFRGAPEEVTLELNPGVVEIGRVPGFRSAGVTRLSVGVQSLTDERLRRLGRAHKERDALRGLEACLAAGFASLSADLIYAAPGQTEEELLRDLGRLLDLGVPHLSAYALTIEPGTPFSTAQTRGSLAFPDEDVQLRMSSTLRSQLAAAGLAQYEISNFARPGHRSLHNLRYWRRREVLGLGVSAAGHLGARRYRNASDRASWARAIEAGRPPVEECEEITEWEARRETLYLGLRCLEGVRRSDYLRRFGSAPEGDFPGELEELRALDLVGDVAGSLRLTERGIRFADEVFLRFVGR